jgi:hypothetical protein
VSHEQPISIFSSKVGRNLTLSQKRRIPHKSIHPSRPVQLSPIQWVRPLRVEHLRELDHPVEDRNPRPDLLLERDQLGRPVAASGLQPLGHHLQPAAQLLLAVAVVLRREEGAHDQVRDEADAGEGVLGVVEEPFLFPLGLRGWIRCQLLDAAALDDRLL